MQLDGMKTHIDEPTQVGIQLSMHVTWRCTKEKFTYSRVGRNKFLIFKKQEFLKNKLMKHVVKAIVILLLSCMWYISMIEVTLVIKALRKEEGEKFLRISKKSQIFSFMAWNSTPPSTAGRDSKKISWKKWNFKDECKWTRFSWLVLRSTDRKNVLNIVHKLTMDLNFTHGYSFWFVTCLLY